MTGTTPYILVVDDSLDGREIARQAGCDAFVAKPFDIKAVGDAVVEVVARGRPGLVAVDALSRPTIGGRRSAST
jgi:CheY-like chemotaxis protein